LFYLIRICLETGSFTIKNEEINGEMRLGKVVLTHQPVMGANKCFISLVK